MPGPGGYWLWPALMAATAASATSGGPSVSGKPWPRLMDPVSVASADISAKMVVAKPCRREARYGTRSLTPSSSHRGKGAAGGPPVEWDEQPRWPGAGARTGQPRPPHITRSVPVTESDFLAFDADNHY